DSMCGRPAPWCDMHHIDYWRNGGPTDQANGALLCGRHHTYVHHGGWKLVYDHPAQQLILTRARPDGTECRRTVNLARPLRSEPGPEPGPEPGRDSGCEPERLPL
ncbi:MAG: HNH endonuclease signature motif containing protein, partial [Euzebya sp.]